MPPILEPDLTELVREYVGELPGHIAKIEASVANSDWQEVRRHAHQLKGSGGSYGFPAISEAAAALEQAARSGTGIDQAILALRTVIEAI